MMDQEKTGVQALKKRLAELKDEIIEAERRLPAHSTKPTTMSLLLDLEDERDAIEAKIETMKGDT